MTALETVERISEALAALSDLSGGDIANAAYEFGDNEIERDLELLGEKVDDMKDELDNYQAEQEEESAE